MLNIRKASLTEAPVISGFNLRMAEETERKKLDSHLSLEGVNAVLRDPTKGFYLVAEEDGQLISSLLIQYEWSDWRNCNMWWLHSLYVMPEWRGKGIFASMLNELKRMMHEAGVADLRLYVEHDNVNAQKVYEKLGMTRSHYIMYEL